MFPQVLTVEVSDCSRQPLLLQQATESCLLEAHLSQEAGRYVK